MPPRPRPEAASLALPNVLERSGGSCHSLPCSQAALLCPQKIGYKECRNAGKSKEKARENGALSHPVSSPQLPFLVPFPPSCIPY